MTWGLLLGLSSGLCWGTADFLGGLMARQRAVLDVALWSQVLGGAALVLLLLVLGIEPGGLAWGLLAGVFGAIGMLFFYRGLAVGMMSLVAPVSACGALVPVTLAMIGGEVPSILSLAGITLTIFGIVIVSLQPESEAGQAGFSREALLLALGAALGFGLFFVLLDYGSAQTSASPLWVTVGARIGGILLLASIRLFRRSSGTFWPGRQIGLLAVLGVMDTAANALFAYASLTDTLGIAAVLSSLYPVTTVVLSWLILEERLKLFQMGGVALALVGIVLLSV